MIIVLGVAGAFIATFSFADAPGAPPQPTASLIVRDTPFTLTEGSTISSADVIGAGAVRNTEKCIFPEAKIVVNNVSSMKVVVAYKEDFSIEVVKV